MKHTIKQIVHYRVSQFTGKEEYVLFASDLSKVGAGYTKVCETEVTFETPDDFNPIAAQVETLTAAEAKLREEFNSRIEQIKEQISKLTCITYEVPA